MRVRACWCVRAIGARCDINGLGGSKSIADACLNSRYFAPVATWRMGLSGSGKTRTRQQLTALAIERFKPETKPYRVLDTRAAGLALRVAPDGGKTWDLAYRIAGAGKVKRLSLGRYGDPGATLDDMISRSSRSSAIRSRPCLPTDCQPLFAEAPHFWTCNPWIADLPKVFLQEDCCVWSTPRDNSVLSTAHLRIKCSLSWRKE